MRGPEVTRHARQRLQQRGARLKELAIVMAYADIDVPARNDSRFLRLSHEAAAALLRDGSFPVQDIDRARRLMVLADSTNRVVTVLKCDPQRRFSGRRRGGSHR
jgi:hypothetical protein